MTTPSPAELKSLRERAKEFIKVWTDASKVEKWSHAPGDIHNYLEEMMDAFEESEAQLREAEAALEFYASPADGEDSEICILDCHEDFGDVAKVMENSNGDTLVPLGTRARQALDKLRGGGG